MAMNADQLAEAALQLPLDLRAQLADKLVESLELAEPSDIQRIWITEAFRRRDEVRSGEVEARPAEEVLAEVRRSVGR